MLDMILRSRADRGRSPAGRPISDRTMPKVDAAPAARARARAAFGGRCIPPDACVPVAAPACSLERLVSRAFPRPAGRFHGPPGVSTARPAGRFHGPPGGPAGAFPRPAGRFHGPPGVSTARRAFPRPAGRFHGPPGVSTARRAFPRPAGRFHGPPGVSTARRAFYGPPASAPGSGATRDSRPRADQGNPSDISRKALYRVLLRLERVKDHLELRRHYQVLDPLGEVEEL